VKKRKRMTLAIMLSLIALSFGAMAARRAWRRDSGQDSARLGLLYEAWNEFNARHEAKAKELLDRRAAEVEPTPLDWMLRARIAEAQGQLEEALEHLKHIPDSDPIGAQTRLKAGQIELARRHSRGAEAAYRRALELDPGQVQAYRELAYLYALQRRKKECDALFHALARRTTLDHVLAFAWCQNTCQLWDPYAARKVLTGFVAEDPADRPSRLALAASYQMTNQQDEAADVLRELPDSDPDARAIRIQLAIDRGEIETAEALARAGPADHARLCVLRGQLALHGSDSRQAATYFRDALRLDPEDRDAIQGLGLALRSLGDPLAKELLDASSRLDQLKRTIQDSVTTIQTDPKLFFKLGEMCEALKRLEESRAWYRLAIGRDPLDEQAHQALARLEQRVTDSKDGSEPASAEVK
jgi:tetratricopeptide (TPR) repeat protein